MSIRHSLEKIKNIPLPANSEAGETVSYDKDGSVVRFPLFRKLFLSLVIILVSALSFGIGRLSVVGNREPVKIEYDQSLVQDSQLPPTPQVNNTASVINAIKELPPSTEATVVVSKNGARYHYLYCSGAKQIKEENKIIFATPSLAEAAGYTLAANCSPR